MVEMDPNVTVKFKNVKRKYVGALSMKRESLNTDNTSPSKHRKKGGDSSQSGKTNATTYRKWKKITLEKKLEKEEKRKLNLELEHAKKDVKNILQESKPTVSIAVPGSILSVAQSKELATYLVGQIARAAAIYKINEIVVFDDTGTTRSDNADQNGLLNLSDKRRECLKMACILQYLECPQYLRKHFFPVQNNLKYAGLLNPLDAPHHLRFDEDSPFREGVVRNGNVVDIGLKHTIKVDKVIEPRTRVTVKIIKPPGIEDPSKFRGILVAPDAPEKEMGLYWGYKVRVAHSLGSVFSECPYAGGYDVTIGTSDKGTPVNDLSFQKFKHMIVVFGGVHGLEASLEADERLEVEEVKFLFDHYINTCEGQGSRTIRTEEAILLSLAALQPKIMECK